MPIVKELKKEEKVEMKREANQSRKPIKFDERPKLYFIFDKRLSESDSNKLQSDFSEYFVGSGLKDKSYMKGETIVVVPREDKFLELFEKNKYPTQNCYVVIDRSRLDNSSDDEVKRLKDLCDEKGIRYAVCDNSDGYRSAVDGIKVRIQEEKQTQKVIAASKAASTAPVKPMNQYEFKAAEKSKLDFKEINDWCKKNGSDSKKRERELLYELCRFSREKRDGWEEKEYVSAWIDKYKLTHNGKNPLDELHELGQQRSLMNRITGKSTPEELLMKFIGDESEYQKLRSPPQAEEGYKGPSL